ncbi:MobC family plasmid mobilization relaxosome protein [Mesorhizobium sophorae]|uniref:MobC family plasmid mobilization relaxosome protein n=1 Tax=Mesorhizobium sophorae TaxID=1300294 RepID=UPI000BA33D33|nr:MobC family plasmid mobilization relaxosome protein [Mesorhizobium sophorae]
MPEQRQTIVTTFRLSLEERAALDASADAAGVGPSSYARRAVMAAVGRAGAVRRKPDGAAKAIGAALGDLGRIGNNINQLARHAHVGGRVPAEALAAVRQELAQLTTAVLSVRLERPR